MSKIKIMHLLQSDRFSGAENVVCQIIELLKQSQYEMIYVCPFGPIEETLKEKNIVYYGLKKFSNKEIKKAINDINPDIIHAHDFNASVRAVKCRNQNEIIISHLHNNPLWLSKFDYRTLIYTYCLKYYKHIIGVSEAVRKEYLFSNRLNSNFSTLPNAVDKKKVLELAKEKCEIYADVLYVGRMSHEKNPLGFLEVVKNLTAKDPNIQALMIGEGPLFDMCKEYIDKNSLNTNVQLVGYSTNPYKYMKNAKVLVMPSYYEGFGLVAIEAMVLGVPVVCRAVGGLTDIINSDVGCLCNTDSEFTTKIFHLLTHESERIKYGEKAKKRADLFCNVLLYKNKIELIYEKVLSEQGD